MLKVNNTILLVIDLQVRMMPVIHNNEALVQKVAACISACKLLDIPILTMQQYTKGLGETVPALQAALGTFKHIEKNTFSCYGSPEFVESLEQSGRTNVIIAGVETHICVQQTVLDLLKENYNVYIAADCVGSRKEFDFGYAVTRMDKAGAIFTTMESILFELLVRSDHPKRKEITSLIVNL